MRDTPGIVGVAQHVERAQVIVVELSSGATNTPQHDLARRLGQRQVEALTRAVRAARRVQHDDAALDRRPRRSGRDPYHLRSRWRARSPPRRTAPACDEVDVMHARFPQSASETPIRSRVPARRSPPCRGTWGAGRRQASEAARHLAHGGGRRGEVVGPSALASQRTRANSGGVESPDCDDWRR